MRGNPHVRFGGRRRGNHRPQGRHGASPPTQLKAPDKQTVAQLALLGEVQQGNKPMFRAFLLKKLLYHLDDPVLAPAHLDAWLAWASRSRLQPFIKLAARSAATATASSPPSDSDSATGVSKASTAASA